MRSKLSTIFAGLRMVDGFSTSEQPVFSPGRTLMIAALILIGAVIGGTLCAGIGGVARSPLHFGLIGFTSGAALTWTVLKHWIHPAILCAAGGALVSAIIGYGADVGYGKEAVAESFGAAIVGAAFGFLLSFVKLEYRAVLSAPIIGLAMAGALELSGYRAALEYLDRTLGSRENPLLFAILFFAACALMGFLTAKMVRNVM